jgi:hypothetical protein
LASVRAAPLARGAVAGPEAATRRSVWAARATAALVFLSFFPYPALPIGNSTGLQANHVLALLLLPLAILDRRARRHWAVLYLVLLPACLSAAVTAATSDLADPSLIYKAVGQLGLALFVLVPAGMLARWDSLSAAVGGFGLALMAHAAVALYQVQAFASGRFPLLGLYANPSFREIAPVADRIALYEKRPFGLFPEPSAMTASIGPWLVLVAGLLLFPAFRAHLSVRSRRIGAAGFAAGALLLVLGKSGNSPIIVVACLAVALAALRTHASGPGWGRASLAFAALLIAAMPLGVFVFRGLAERQTRSARGIESWGDRFDSIRAGLGFLGRGVGEAIFGVGPGQGQLLIIKNGVNSVGAIWSDAARYIAETGIVGAGAVAAVLALAVVSIIRSGARLMGFACLGAWVASVVLTTSYLELSPLWTFLAFLLVWDRLFRRAPG